MDQIAAFTLTGIVDSIEAKRTNELVTHLAAKVRIETPFDSPYYNQEKVIDNITLSLDPLSAVNPGDVVGVEITIARPTGQRFAHALEATASTDG